MGYWHNWNSTKVAGFPLREVPPGVTRVAVAFAVPASEGSGELVFEPAVQDERSFRRDLRALQLRGIEVVLSVGGGRHPVELHTEASRDAFVQSIQDIFARYPFDGLDVDLEGVSTVLEEGDTDFRNPTTPKIRHLIQALHTLCAHFGEGWILSCSPETQYVTTAYHRYGGAYGGYLPILHALREKWDVVHMQLYNSGSQYVYTGQGDGASDPVVEQGTAAFVVGLTEMVIEGFPIARDPRLRFPGLGADRVAVGLPATPDSASGGYTPPAEVYRAFQALWRGKTDRRFPFELRNPEGYPQLRGFMTWSLNWDRQDSISSEPFGFSSMAAGLVHGTPAKAE
jgi:chitinase